MLTKKKKLFIFLLGASFVLSFLVFSFSETQAISANVRQVRTKDNPAVYFLSHGIKRKKVYLNADVYLSYGNRWQDVSYISSSELNAWPEVKLIKQAASPAVFYVKDGKKALIKSWQDLESFSLASEPIMTVSPFELNSYPEVTAENIGLLSGVSINESPSGEFLIVSVPVTGANNNSLLSGTDGNLVGIFNFTALEKEVKVSAVTFNFTGLFSEPLLRSGYVTNVTGTKYNANFSLRQSARELIVSFREPLVIPSGKYETLKVYLNTSSGNFTTQTVKVGIREAGSVTANAVPLASFPLVNTEFKMIDGANFLAKVKSQENSLASSTNVISPGNRLIGQFTLTEESGQEEALVKNLVFINNGSAGKNEWEDFRLYSNGQIIARAKELNSGRDIEFNINYLRLKKGTPAVLTIVAALKTDRNQEATVDLSLDSITAVGKTYSASLAPEIKNITSSFILN